MAVITVYMTLMITDRYKLVSFIQTYFCLLNTIVQTLIQVRKMRQIHEIVIDIPQVILKKEYFYSVGLPLTQGTHKSQIDLLQPVIQDLQGK